KLPPPPKKKRPPPPTLEPEFPEELDGVMVAVSPAFTLPICVVSTPRFTTNALLITSTCADDELLFELLLPPELLEAALLLRPEPVAEPVRFVAELPDEFNTWPTVRLTVDTTPSTGDVSDAPERFWFAVARVAYAEATFALSRLICADDAPE